MNGFEILTQDGKAAFEPGETIHGLLRWEGITPPGSIELRLFWHTRGKGTEDSGVAERVPIPGAGPAGEYRFRFCAPSAPYSYEGKLLSILWGIEAVPEHGEPSEPLMIIIGPGWSKVRMRPGKERSMSNLVDEIFEEENRADEPPG